MRNPLSERPKFAKEPLPNISATKLKAIRELRNDVIYVHNCLFGNPDDPMTERKKALIVKATNALKLANEYIQSVMREL